MNQIVHEHAQQILQRMHQQCITGKHFFARHTLLSRDSVRLTLKILLLNFNSPGRPIPQREIRP